MIDILKKYWILILAGFLLRLAVSGFTFHPDVITPALTSAVFFREGTFNFYENSFKYAPGEVLDDLPLSYLISLPMHLITRSFIVDTTENLFFQNRSAIFGDPRLWGYLIYVKLPLILFDITLGIILALSFTEYKKRLLILWMFNPITLWATSAIGQLDIYPTFFIVLAYLLIKKGQLNFAALSLGTGGAIKTAPFLLIPLLLGLAKNSKERILILSLAAIPYLLTVIPYLGLSDFRQNALFAPQLSKILFAALSLSGLEAIYVVPALLAFFYLLYFSKDRSTSDFLTFSVAILLSTLTFTHFHMQWFLWVTPFLFIWFLNNWQRSGIQLAAWLLFMSWLVMLSLFDSSLQVKLFAPLYPSFDQAIGLKEVLTVNQSIFLRNLSTSIFASSGIFLIWKMLRAG